MRVVVIPCLSDNFAYLIIDGGNAAVVDPSEAEPIEEMLRKEGVALAAIWLTHHHWDHVGGVAKLVDAHPGIAVVISKIDAAKLEQETRRCVTRLVEEHDTVSLGNVSARVIHNPGHTLGAISFYFEHHPLGRGSVFTGDTLFAAGCGRMFEGTPEMFYAALRKLAQLPDRTEVFFGHEYTAANLAFAAAAEPDNGAVKVAQSALKTPSTPSTIAAERATNPFIRADDAAEFARRREWKNSFK
ncbi:MAG: hydroxyacylglutathione hydrolase [Kofleriaceae bacterium]